MISLKKHFVIGFAGQRRTGKNTCIERFRNNLLHISESPVVVLDLGDVIKEYLAALTGGSVAEIEKNKDNKVLRIILESLNRVIKEETGQDPIIGFMKTTIALAPEPSFFLVALRKKAEADVIHENGGFIYLVRRNLEQVLLETERELEQLNHHAVIRNDGTLKMLELVLDDLFYDLLYSARVESITLTEP